MRARGSVGQGRRHLIVQVTPYYPPRLGGMERVAQCVATVLAGRHDVEVITTRNRSDGSPPREMAGWVLVRRFRGYEIAHTAFSMGMVVRLLTLPRRTIVHAHVAQAFLPEMVWLTSWLRRRPYILHFHLDVDPSGRFGRLLPVYKRLVLGPVLRRAAAVIALSPAQADFLATGYRVARTNIAVLPNGVDPAFSGAGKRSHDHRRDGALRLLFVGRLDAQKNVLRLLDAMSQVQAPVELVIVGDGEQRGLAAERVRSLGLPNVRFAGAQTGDELLAWYRWADAFVLPSDKEGMPLVLLEAMAAGLPIIATDVPGSHELLDGVGLLTAPNASALGAAIERLSTDPDLRARLVANSAERGTRYSWTERIPELERLYDRVVSTR
ncbi:glycosyl transferase [Pseudonocardia asaccharolytica DSM 44247 = NBRC 16224]|uniref:Glycosyl transferase n=2 Tax=Pseudonocardia asaccharolytica TaxID=54010 RepID=A0A511CXB9_9PSEU|nr:glycosyl transferase [Pseudonocardia asaccharolytica DSM 44247 = NBRC 16224]